MAEEKIQETATAIPQKTIVLSEALDLSEAQVDSDNRVIRGVVLIRAGMSKNRRYYGENALKEAVNVFENSKAYANHPSKTEQKDRPERSILDLTGWYSGVTYKEGAVYADRYFTRNQAGNDAWAIAEDIASKRAPASLAGLSINAVGKGAMKKFDDGDALEVESITSANSIDDVSTPAAGGGYVLTASAGDEMINGILESISYQEWLLARPEFVEKLKREYKAVRLEEATKTAIAEADRKVKAAEAAALEAQQALTEAQSEHGSLTTANGKLAADNTALRVELAVIEALEKVALPASYVNDLRKELPKLPPAEWAEKIETEISKLKSAGGKPKVTVTNAGFQEASRLPKASVTPKADDQMPRDSETVADWMKRTGRS